MQKYDESFDRYVPQPFRGGVKAPEHEPVDRESQHFVHKTKNLFESMDFEETESVMWRKVSLIFIFICQFLLANISHTLFTSINFEDSSKIEELGGLTRGEPLQENGC